jgi:site-specific DNA recombinase
MVEVQANIMLAFAALERRTKAEQLAWSQAEAKAEGVWCSEVPLGYVRDANRRLVVHEPDAQRVRRIYELAVAREPWRAMARQVAGRPPGAT